MFGTFRGSRCVSVAAIAVIAMSIVTAGSTASADPVGDSGLLAAESAPNGSVLDGVNVIDDRHLALQVYSTSTQRLVPVHVQWPADTSRPRPSLCFREGGIRREKTGMTEFLADTNVNVISPTGGEDAYWTDWKSQDPAMGVMQMCVRSG